MELFRELIALSHIMHHDAVSRAVELSVMLVYLEQSSSTMTSYLWGMAKEWQHKYQKKLLGLHQTHNRAVDELPPMN